MSAAYALRAAIHEALAADAVLADVLGGPRIYDEPPASPEFPYVTLGEAQTIDASTATEDGLEHRLTLHAWSRQGGHAEAHRIAAAVQDALHDADLSPVGCRLVNLRATAADIRRTAGGRSYHAQIRFRAITENT